ncbi:hypothetical protein HK098_006251 [Nowakowskiella sp. JEL0407]|nr:hypothetical protein HK098_006251 [Nowakowskiella sp. JEL0407]
MNNSPIRNDELCSTCFSVKSPDDAKRSDCGNCRSHKSRTKTKAATLFSSSESSSNSTKDLQSENRPPTRRTRSSSTTSNSKRKSQSNSESDDTSVPSSRVTRSSAAQQSSSNSKTNAGNQTDQQDEREPKRVRNAAEQPDADEIAEEENMQPIKEKLCMLTKTFSDCDYTPISTETYPEFSSTPFTYNEILFSIRKLQNASPDSKAEAVVLADVQKLRPNVEIFSDGDPPFYSFSFKHNDDVQHLIGSAEIAKKYKNGNLLKMTHGSKLFFPFRFIDQNSPNDSIQSSINALPIAGFIWKFNEKGFKELTKEDVIRVDQDDPTAAMELFVGMVIRFGIYLLYVTVVEVYSRKGSLDLHAEVGGVSVPAKLGEFTLLVLKCSDSLVLGLKKCNLLVTQCVLSHGNEVQIFNGPTIKLPFDFNDGEYTVYIRKLPVKAPQSVLCVRNLQTHMQFASNYDQRRVFCGLDTVDFLPATLVTLPDLPMTKNTNPYSLTLQCASLVRVICEVYMGDGDMRKGVFDKVISDYETFKPSDTSIVHIKNYNTLINSIRKEMEELKDDHVDFRKFMWEVIKKCKSDDDHKFGSLRFIAKQCGGAIYSANQRGIPNIMEKIEMYQKEWTKKELKRRLIEIGTLADIGAEIEEGERLKLGERNKQDTK